VDTCLGAQQMVDILTNKNLSREDQVRELQETVDNLGKFVSSVQSSEFKGKIVETKTYDEIIENELKKLDVENLTRHVHFLTLFLPEQFLKRGADQRLIDQLNFDDVVKSHRAEQWSFSCKLSQSLSIFQMILRKFVKYEKSVCVNPFVWNVRTIIRPGTSKTIQAPLCNAVNTCFTKTFDILFNSLALMKEYCSDCFKQCSITDFIVQLSSSVVPVEWQMNGIKAFVENSSIPLPINWSTTWPGYIHGNYLAVDVVRETNVLEKNTQSATMNLVDVLSNIGGQFGLWIGISFLSIMELIEMLY
ncbi:unnamed protein product, partial [Rotaria sp. Silwood1]